MSTLLNEKRVSVGAVPNPTFTVRLNQMQGGRKVLVVASHPDDEILGCGGTMAKHVNDGDEVHVVFLAEGITSRKPKKNREILNKDLSDLGRSAHQANKIIGTKSLRFLDFPDNRMDSVELLDVVKALEEIAADLRPEIVYTQNFSDLNIDHRITHDAVITAFRPLPKEICREIYFFEVPSSTEWKSYSSFTPQYFVNISKYLPKKIKALRAYKSEMRPWPHPRSYKGVQALAEWRGVSVGVAAAEAFMVGRVIT